MQQKTLKTMLKYIQRQIDEKSIAMRKIDNQLNIIYSQRNSLQTTIENEKNAVAQATNVIFGFGEFLYFAMDKRKVIDANIAITEAKKERMRNSIIELFQEKKKLLHILSKHISQQAKKESANEQKLLDELSRVDGKKFNVTTAHSQ